MQFISPFMTEDTARIAGRQPLSQLLSDIRLTIAMIVHDSEDAHTRLLLLSTQATTEPVEPVEPVEIDTMATINSEHANMLVNVVIALDEYLVQRGKKTVQDWLIGGPDNG